MVSHDNEGEVMTVTCLHCIIIITLFFVMSSKHTHTPVRPTFFLHMEQRLFLGVLGVEGSGFVANGNGSAELAGRSERGVA